MKPLVALLVSCALSAACGGDSGNGSGNTNDPLDTGADALPVQDDAAIDRGPDGYRIAVVRTDHRGDGDVDEILTHAYDDDGRIASDTYEEPTEGLSRVVVYDHDGGRLISKTDGTETLAYSYVDGRVRRVDEGEGLFAEYLYDAMGHLASMILGGESIDDDDGGPFVDEPAEPVLVTIDVEFGYRDSRLDTVTFSGQGELISTTRYRYDDDDLLDSIVTAHEDERRSSSATLVRDAAGRLASITETELDGRESVATFSYERDRLVTVRIDGRSLLDLSGREFTQTLAFEYSDLGLLERATTTVDGETDEDTAIVSVRTFEYENEPCLGQPSAQPELNLTGALHGISRASSSALDCGYWLDDF